MLQFIQKYKLTLIGIALGAVAGYAYYYFVGCNSGTCAITSKPVNSTVYGAVMGALVFSSFKKEEVKNKQTDNGK
ncbi:MAG: hypothetical protein KF781_05910 [Chitinophagaceae bacterium]|nr:hypothetical protein [Chitinophagaceae bacterium]MCW5906069.1 hypothetical protein [Chitinophagaceae bacterium]